MRFGVCVPNYGESGSPEAIRNIAVEAEKLGFDSIWCTDHLLMPPDSNTPYDRIFESITTIAYLAAITTKVRLGISSLITAMRNPAVVAKQLATVDNLSNGRLILATSAGWNEKEFGHLGSNYHNRGRRLDESLRLIRTLWNGGTSFESKLLHQKFSNATFSPPPVQKHLTIWIAGSSPAAMKRAATLGDAWHPHVLPLDEFAKLVSQFRENFPQARDKPVCPRLVVNLKAEKSEYTSPLGQRRILLSANRADSRRIIDGLKELGVSYVVLVPSPDGKATVSTQIEAMKTVAQDFLRP